MQIKAGFKKEWMMFSRTFKCLGVMIAIFAFAIVDPLMMKGMDLLFTELEKMTEEHTASQSISDSESSNYANLSLGIGIDLDENTEKLASEEGSSDFMGQMNIIYGSSTATGFYSAMSDITNTGTLIILIVLMAAAGGEQKKRSTMIPDCAGLSPKNYLLPKFVLYPLFCFAATFLATFVAYGVSLMVFTTPLEISNVLFAAVCAGVYQFFIVSLYFLFGICTSKPGVGTIIIFISTGIIPVILSAAKANKYNPFALLSMLTSDVGDVEMSNFVLSIVVTFILYIIMYFITLLVLTAKKIDNRGSDAHL